MNMAEHIRYSVSLVTLAVCAAISTLQGQETQLSPQSSVTTLRFQRNEAMTGRYTPLLANLRMN